MKLNIYSEATEAKIQTATTASDLIPKMIHQAIVAGKSEIITSSMIPAVVILLFIWGEIERYILDAAIMLLPPFL